MPPKSLKVIVHETGMSVERMYTVKCPHCEALPGQPCTQVGPSLNKSGKRWSHPHAVRIQAVRSRLVRAS
jgi:hypothetical protein